MSMAQCDNMVHTGGPMHGGSGQVGHRRRTGAGLQYLRRDGPDCVGGPLPIDSQGERRLAVRWRRDGPRRGGRIGGRRLTRRATGRARASRRAWRRGRAWDAAVHDNSAQDRSSLRASFGCKNTGHVSLTDSYSGPPSHHAPVDPPPTCGHVYDYPPPARELGPAAFAFTPLPSAAPPDSSVTET